MTWRNICADGRIEMIEEMVDDGYDCTMAAWLIDLHTIYVLALSAMACTSALRLRSRLRCRHDYSLLLCANCRLYLTLTSRNIMFSHGTNGGACSRDSIYTKSDLSIPHSPSPSFLSFGLASCASQT